MHKGSKQFAGGRRQHDAKFKSRIFAECARGDRSIAAVARAHGLSAQRIYQWRHDAGAAQGSGSQAFRRIELSTAAPLSPSAKDFIRIELSGSGGCIELHWPVAHASGLTAWLDQR